MYFCKVPISLFNSQKPETIYSILQFHFNKTINCTDETIYKEGFTDLTPEKTFIFLVQPLQRRNLVQ